MEEGPLHGHLLSSSLEGLLVEIIRGKGLSQGSQLVGVPCSYHSEKLIPQGKACQRLHSQVDFWPGCSQALRTVVLVSKASVARAVLGKRKKTWLYHQHLAAEPTRCSRPAPPHENALNSPTGPVTPD